MKTQLYCFAFLAFISLISSDSVFENNILTFEKFELESIQDFHYQFRKVFKDKDQTAIPTTIDFTNVRIGPISYWDLIVAINSEVDDSVKSISVIFGPDLIKDSKESWHFDHVLAEMAIVTKEIPRVVPDFDSNSDVFKNYAYYAYMNMRNAQFDGETLTVKIPSFNQEFTFLHLNFDAFMGLPPPFIKISHKLYDYMFAYVDFLKVKKIRLFHYSLFDYLNTLFLPNLEELNFDFDLFQNEYYNGAGSLDVSEFADAILENNKNKKLVISIDKKGINRFSHFGIEYTINKYQDSLTIKYY